MTNRLRSEVEEEEQRLKELEEPKLKVQKPREKRKPINNAFTSFFRGAVSKEAATDALPFVLFISFLAMIYIGNRHNAENNIRKIEGLKTEVKELSWDFKTLKADLMFKSRQTQVIKQVDSLLGLKVSIEPPIKLNAN